MDAPARREQDAALGLIDEETHLLSYCGMLRDAGANLLVAGSALYGAQDAAAMVKLLRGDK